MSETIQQLEQYVQDALDKYRGFYYRAASTEQAGKITMGPHIAVRIPQDVRIGEQDLKFIKARITRAYGKVTRVIRHKGTSRWSSDPTIYRDYTFVLEEDG